MALQFAKFKETWEFTDSSIIIVNTMSYMLGQGWEPTSSSRPPTTIIQSWKCKKIPIIACEKFFFFLFFSLRFDRNQQQQRSRIW